MGIKNTHSGTGSIYSTASGDINTSTDRTRQNADRAKTRYSSFLSFSHTEIEVARTIRTWMKTICETLSPCFMSDIDIGAGEEWRESIGQALREAKVLFVICSPDSVGRPWLNFETGAAYGRDIPVIPLLHKGLSLSSLPSIFSPYQGYTIESADEITRMVSALNQKFNSEIPNDTMLAGFHSDLRSAASA